LTFRDYAADVLAARRRLERGRATRHGTIVDPDARPRHAAMRTGTGGLAAWHDHGPVADAARRALRDAAGVSVPSRRFVVAMLIGYLVVLVPMNWLVFRLIGRPSWAWAAAPVIALAATAVIVPAAGLNVGFVRARSEIALIEFQPDWPRAHVTRYTSLYTSIATSYTVRSDSPGGVALPMSDGTGRGAAGVSPLRGPHSSPLPEGEGTEPGASGIHVCYSPGDRPSLSGVVVASNTTGLIHAEETLDFSGPIELIDRPGGSELIRNRSGLKLRHVTVIAKQRNGRIVTARRPVAAKLIAAIDVRPIYELAIDPTTLEPGEVRLVAISDTPPPGMAIRPAAGQSTSVAVVVAHLRYEHGPEPKGDVNAYEASGGY